jgi:hypothetical protein
MSLLEKQDVERGSRRTAEGTTRRSRRRLRRALRDQDRISASLAELHAMDDVLAAARTLLAAGWMQNAWFTYVGASGESVEVVACTPRAARRLASQEVTAACLVGAIVHAGGGPSEARSQLVQRTCDLAWHTLFRSASERVRWYPSSLERAAHLLDLIYWNDRPGRTADEVIGLVDGARRQLGAEVERTRSQQESASRLVAAAAAGRA